MNLKKCDIVYLRENICINGINMNTNDLYMIYRVHELTEYIQIIHNNGHIFGLYYNDPRNKFYFYKCFLTEYEVRENKINKTLTRVPSE